MLQEKPPEALKI